MKSLFSSIKIKPKQLLLLISIINITFTISEGKKEQEKNSSPLVHPVMAPASMSPLGGVSKIYKKINKKISLN